MVSINKYIESPLKEILQKLCNVENFPVNLDGIWSTKELSDEDFDTLQWWIADNDQLQIVSWTTGIGILDVADAIVDAAYNNGNIKKYEY